MMQKIGLIHNRYSSTVSGEDKTVDAIIGILQASNFELRTLVSDGITQDISMSAKIQLAKRQLLNITDSFPDSWTDSLDAIQIHNTFPSFTKHDFNSLKKFSGAIVKVVQNYRLSCLNGQHFRRNASCSLCSVRNGAINGILNGCYQESNTKSGFVEMHRRALVDLLRKRNAYFIAVSRSIGEYLVGSGFSKDRIVVIPNSVPPRQVLDEDRKSEVFYSGLLSSSKGITHLLNAWSFDHTLPKLHIVGDGPLARQVKIASSRDSRIVYYGPLDTTRLEEVARKCAIAVVPSAWNEPFGRVALEAYSRGQFLVATAFGGLKDLLRNEVSLEIELDCKSISQSIRKACRLVDNFEIRKSIEIWESEFSPNVIQTNWLRFYNTVLTK